MTINDWLRRARSWAAERARALTAYFDRHFVSGWRGAWRWASVRLAVLAGGIASAVAASPDLAAQIYAALPAEVRATLPVWLAVVITAAPIVARLWRSPRG